MNFIDSIIELIEDSVMQDADIWISWWNIIKSWYDKDIDNDRLIIEESERWISEYQKTLIWETWITALKIKFSTVQWYFIEIPHAQTSNILPSFIPRQSLTGVSRYSTDELGRYEAKLQSATSELNNKEYRVFLNIRNIVSWQYNNIYSISRKISNIDFLSNGAYISRYRSYNCPNIKKEFSLEIVSGKHPVISLNEADFISNSVFFDKKDFIHVITGPNMWWKSTFLRQNALLILMAHIGYDIPCKSSNIGLVDKIFSRVWSWDNLYLWQSTFMVEMQEISYILRHSTKKSFVIIDEIWRGTSTYDGMSLAQSILEYNQRKIWAKTLFATHYHEIIDYAENLAGASNYSVSVWENEKNIVFLRKIIPGWIKKSYGIEVASLAGIPEQVLTNARKLMSQFQSKQNYKQLQIPDVNVLEKLNEKSQVENIKSQEIIDSIKNIDLERISPIEWIRKVSEIQEKIKKI